MKKIKKGEIVGRISYEKDIFFVVDRLIKLNNNTQIAILKGLTMRIKADSPLEDLEIIDKRIIQNTIDSAEKRFLARLNKYRNRLKKVYNYGRILHLDGDPRYSQKSIKYYREIGIDAIVKNISENRQPLVVRNLLQRFKPDILVKEKDRQSAINAILKCGGYKQKKAGAYDVSFVSPNGTLIELHHKLFADKKRAKKVPDVWVTAQSDGLSGYRFKMNDDAFCHYHILHMAKHFENGGCGIRSFVDLRLIEQAYNLDSDEVEKLLKKSGLSAFSHYARRLCAIWFDGQEHDEITLQMEKYILDGGVFGTEKTKIISQQQRTGGKRQYFLSKIFVPYRSLKYLYPALEKYPFLFPFYEVHRWFSFLFGNRKKFRKNYAKLFDRVLSEQPENYSLFENLGLK